MKLIGLNYTVLDNMPTINTTIVPNTSAELITEVISSANTMTNGYLGYLILITVSIITYIILSDKTPLTDFGYDDARSITLAFGISAILGTVLMEINFITSFSALGFISSLYMLTYIYNIYVESKSETE